jgi:hypothetical protein
MSIWRRPEERAVRPGPRKADDGVASMAAARCVGVQTRSDRRHRLHRLSADTDPMLIGYHLDDMVHVGGTA